MTTNSSSNLTPEQEQRAEALRTAARIVAGSGAVLGPSPGVPEDRTFDVQEFARWIVKGDDDDEPDDDEKTDDRTSPEPGPPWRPMGYLTDEDDEDDEPRTFTGTGPVFVAPTGTGPTVVDGLIPRDEIVAAMRRQQERAAADAVQHIVDTENARPNPIAPNARITYAGADVGEVTNVEETADGIRVTGTLDEPFGDRIARLLVETGPTTGDDVEEQLAARDMSIDDDRRDWHAKLGDVIDEEVEGDDEQPFQDPPGSPGTGYTASALGGQYRLDAVQDAEDGPDAQPHPWGRQEFRAGYGVEPDRRRTLRRVVPTGYSESRLAYYPATPGPASETRSRAGWALGPTFARFPWPELPAGYGRFIYADEA